MRVARKKQELASSIGIPGEMRACYLTARSNLTTDPRGCHLLFLELIFLPVGGSVVGVPNCGVTVWGNCLRLMAREDYSDCFADCPVDGGSA